MTHRFLPPGFLAGLVAALAVGLTTGNLYGQDSLRTGDGLLMIRAAMPETTRLGEQFMYEVEVRNVSDNVVLHNIKLNQQRAKGFSVDSVSLKESEANNNEQSDRKEQNSQSKNSMSIDKLAPGQSQTLVVKATADEEGELRSCLEIESYTPALCLTSQIVKPELELTKSAPKEANRCDVIELEYTLKNGGSGDVGKITITDSLGEGLATIDGESDLSFQVDGLPAGQTRQFVARVFAEKTGDFTSRATAKATEGNLQSRSKPTTIKVIAADLQAKIDGPGRVYGGQLAKFTASITNVGNVAADDVQVNLMWPANANLVDLGEFEIKGDKNASEQAKSDNRADQNDKERQAKADSAKQPTPAQPEKSDKSTKTASKENSSESPSQEMNRKSFTIERLEAGQTAEFVYAIRPGDLESLPTRVEALHVCTVNAAEARNETTTMAMTETKIVRLPALQLVVIDDEDPVADGSKVTYRVRIWNEGDAADSNVRLTVKLPEGLKFDDANGPTEHEAKGNTINFEPIENLEAGDRVDYVVIAKPTSEGNVRVQASIQSDSLDQKVTSEEPTRLFAQASE